MKYYKNILQMIGHTPLIQIDNGCGENGPMILAKIEFQNPGGSIKDRMVYHILKKEMDQGNLKPGDTVIDNTSGNTGVAIAMVCARLGLNSVITTPEKTSKEKVDLIKSFGAEVIVTPTEAAHHDPESSYMVAINLSKEKGYFHLNQYDNPNNPEAHYLTTGPEIWDDTDGNITHFVAGIGTGGTFSGVAKFLKEQNADIRTYAVDPEGSIFAEYIKDDREIEPQNYKVEGIGSDCITQALLPEYVDEVITVGDEDSFATARSIAKSEGLSVGGSAGSAIFAARSLAKKLSNNDLIVTIVADSGIRYLSKCFNDVWMKEHGFSVETV